MVGESARTRTCPYSPWSMAMGDFATVIGTVVAVCAWTGWNP